MALTKATLIDLNSNELVLDLDADTSITADTDDTIHFKIAGSDEITMTAGAIAPSTSDGNALGTTSLMFSDLFLASGSVVNFNNGDVTLTHASNTLVLAGGSLDINGQELILDADADTSITASTDDQIDFRIGGSDLITFTAGKIDLKNAGTASQILFYCESSNAHAQTLIGAPHSEAASNTLTLPGTGGNARLVSTTSTATLTNKTLTTPVIAEIDSGSTITLDATTDIVLDADGGDIFFKDGGTTIATFTNSSTDFIIESATSDKDIIFKVNDGGSSTEVARFDGDVSSFKMASGKKIMLGAAEETISGNGTDITFEVGSSGDINIPANIGLTFGDDGEKIEGDGTDLTIAGNNINLTAVADVVIPANVGITFGTGEKIEGNNTDLTVTSGADINLTATTDINVPSGVGVTFGDDGEKIEGDGTDLTIASSNDLNLTATTDINIPSNVGLTFGDDGEKIEGNGTNLTLSSSNDMTLDAAADIVLDAAGDQVRFHSAGTLKGFVNMASNNITLKSETSDADIIFQGNDGGSSITAATFDMSEGGDLTLGANTNIVFPATNSVSTGANTLDDYEEGSFTPTVTANSVAYDNRTGRYTKVGNKVFVECLLQWNSASFASATGKLTITGLPFTPLVIHYHGTYGTAYISSVNTNNTDGVAVLNVIASANDQSAVELIVYNNDAGGSYVKNDNNANGVFSFCITYRTTA